MNPDKQKLINGISKLIIGSAYAVGNTLGAGFLEKVYENALAYELKQNGLKVEQQVPMKVKYKGIVVGEYITDLLVEETVIVELKAVKEFDNVHKAQCMNYLRATGLNICLLINFGKPMVEVKRIIYES